MSVPEASKEKKDEKAPKSSSDKLKDAISTMSENGILVAICVFVAVLIIAFWGDIFTIMLNVITEKAVSITQAFVPAKISLIELFRVVIGTAITILIAGLILKEFFKKDSGGH